MTTYFLDAAALAADAAGALAFAGAAEAAGALALAGAAEAAGALAFAGAAGAAGALAFAGAAAAGAAEAAGAAGAAGAEAAALGFAEAAAPFAWPFTVTPFFDKASVLFAAKPLTRFSKSAQSLNAPFLLRSSKIAFDFTAPTPLTLSSAA